MKPLYSDNKTEDDLLESMDSDVVIMNLFEDIQCLKEVSKWTKEKPTEKGFYLNKPPEGLGIGTVHVLEKQNGLYGIANSGSDFFNDCEIKEWLGLWFGPISLN